jgi:hypothetical protein
MVQQGITFLQETVVSYVIEAVLGNSELNNPVYRYAAGGVLNGAYAADRTLRDCQEDIARLGIEEAEIRESYRSMYNFVESIPGLSRRYRELTGKKGFRNDINHCGFRDAPLSPAELKHRLKQLFAQIKPLLYAD